MTDLAEMYTRLDAFYNLGLCVLVGIGILIGCIACKTFFEYLRS